MFAHVFTSSLVGLALAAALGDAQAAGPARRAFDLPPSAELYYSIKARQKGIKLSGDAHVSWKVGDGKYVLTTDSRAQILGKILENRSEGVIDAYGLAPLQFTEKRFRKDPWSTSFDRAANKVSFTEGKLTYPLKGGEQDRGSAQWQLVALARATPEKFKPGSTWTFPVAGRRDIDPWTFKVVGREKVRTGAGAVDAVHLVKSPPPNSKDQEVDIWLAPSLEWYPVRIRFTDNDDEVIEQVLEKID